MTNEEKDDFILRLLKDRAGLLQYIAEVMFTADRNTQGLLGMKERGFSTEGMLDNVIKVTAKQSQQLKHLALIAFMAVQSSDFEVQVAQLMNKMGRGEEALKAMIENRLKGM